MLLGSVVGAILLAYLMLRPETDQDSAETAPEPPPEPRNFTAAQLKVCRPHFLLLIELLLLQADSPAAAPDKKIPCFGLR